MKTYRAAVIGLGSIGMMYDLEPHRPHPSGHVCAYEGSPAFSLVCGIDRDSTKKEWLRKTAPDVAFFSSLEQAFDLGALKNIDVVSICTPPSTHLSFLTRLIRLGIGKVIFCEKPIVLDLDEAGKLKKTVQERGDVTIVPNISRRWNHRLRDVTDAAGSGCYGKLEKINIRYTRGIYNTGAHLFDLLRMWTGSRIRCVMTLNETQTSESAEKTYSFYFEQENGVTGYAEAVDDSRYYLFDIDLYFSGGKIEMRNSGDDVFYYGVKEHHLFEGFRELALVKHEKDCLADPCLQNAVKNIADFLNEGKDLYCTAEDAVYPLYVADALERSYKTGAMEEVAL